MTIDEYTIRVLAKLARDGFPASRVPSAVVSFIAKAYVKARLSVPALRVQAKVTGEAKAPFKVQVRVDFGYVETGAFVQNIQDGFFVDLPTVTDPIAQSQWITVTRSLGGAGVSRFTVARTPFE